MCRTLSTGGAKEQHANYSRYTNLDGERAGTDPARVQELPDAVEYRGSGRLLGGVHRLELEHQLVHLRPAEGKQGRHTKDEDCKRELSRQALRGDAGVVVHVTCERFWYVK